MHGIKALYSLKIKQSQIGDGARKASVSLLDCEIGDGPRRRLGTDQEGPRFPFRAPSPSHKDKGLAIGNI